MVAIEKRIPIPGRNVSPGRPRKYPWLEMKRGDSFYVNGPTTRNSISTSASHASRRYQRRFTVRKLAQGFRVWRIA